MKHSQAAAVALVLAFSCLRPSEERAERDLEVGAADAGSIRVQVRDGLAAVRQLSESQLVLWGSAPGYELELELGAATGELVLELQNCLPEAELQLRSAPEGASLEELGEASVATRKLWRLTSAAGRVQLKLAAPDSHLAGAFRFALLSDVQEAIDRVGDVFRKINQQPNVRFLLGAGDLTERGTREQLEQYQSELLTLRIPYFTTLGNHELGTAPDLYHEYFGRGNFQFRFRGVYFTLLDSASASLDPTVYDWLDDWLKQARHDVHVVAMHIPPIDPIGVRNGSWGSRNEAAKLLGRLAEGRVDVTLYGHVHSYYSFDNAGIPAFISGGGGAIPERFDNLGRHFMLMDVDPDRGITHSSVVRVD
jgi:Icc protein